MRPDQIVGYTYVDGTYCPRHTLELVRSNHPLDYPLFSTIQPGDTPEEILDTVAKSINLDSTAKIDRTDESTFDSADFPKVIFADQAEGSTRCDICHEPLLG